MNDAACSTPVPRGASFEAWLAELRRLAQERDLGWLVSTEAAHRASFERGLAPAEELGQLTDMSEWRGCGCGGGQ